MTLVRRINVSQIQGNNANANDATEIRPFGEVGFFIDENSNPDKLVMLMFEGTRTHLKSKVLSPGILFGSNADSGDGAGFDTIKLIPDSQLHNIGSDQYIIVDPTAPNHIHLRAGGTQDGSSADLFLGAEYTNVKVSDGSDSVTITTSQVGEGVINYSWTFNNQSILTLPSGGALEPVGMGWTGLTNGSSGTPVSIVNKSTNVTYSGQTISDITLYNNADTQGRISINTHDLVAANSHAWIFESYGSIIFPDGSIQNTAWGGGSVVLAPNTSIGDSTDVEGRIAFDSTYFYYCTANYNGIDNIWKRVAWSNDTW
jgi:hypothetical protein